MSKMNSSKILERLQKSEGYDDSTYPTNPEMLSQRLNNNYGYPQQPDYNPMSYDPNDYNNYNYNYNQQMNYGYPQQNFYANPQPQYEEELENPEEYDYENEYEKQCKKEERAFKMKKIKAISLICFVIFYGFALIIGIMNTTVINGNAQFITLEIANERTVYKKIQKGVDNLNDYNTFQGISEIIEVKELGNYQEKITAYSNTIKKLQNEKNEWADYFYKNGSDDVLNAEMVNMYLELLDDQINLLTYVNNYYRLCAAGNSGDAAQLAEMERNIQEKHGNYVNKLIGYSTRLEDISMILRL